VALAAVFVGNDMAACVPVVRARRGPGYPVLATWRHRYCFLGTPLVRSDDDGGAVAALIALLARSVGSSRLIVLDWMATGPVAALVQQAIADAKMGSVVWEKFERAVVGSADRSQAVGLHGHHRRNVARLRRRLEETLGASVRMTRRSDGEFIDNFLSLEASGWKGRQGTAMASRGADATFFHEMATGLAARGRLDLVGLETETETIAMKCTLVAGEAAFCFKAAYNEGFARYSPGTLLEVENLNAFCNSDLAWMDSCTNPRNEPINRLWGGRRELTTLALTPDQGLAGRAMLMGLRGARDIRRSRAGAKP